MENGKRRKRRFSLVEKENPWYNVSMTIHDFIKGRRHLIWYVSDYDALDAEAIVEATLNYGDWDDVKILIDILGVEEVARIFRVKSKPSAIGRTNYRPEVANYFTLYFAKYAS